MKNKAGIPDHIIKQYGSARAFKKEKRMILKQMESMYSELMGGSAFFPVRAYILAKDIGVGIDILRDELSEKKWGR